ncbi:MAG: T9SS type A sorting domain-containing protein [Crocinitomicaceae bacterium]|nr:T9SS type A sorting domain-containing protein [Crocinitomicaceae bacterium]
MRLLICSLFFAFASLSTIVQAQNSKGEIALDSQVNLAETNSYNSEFYQIRLNYLKLVHFGDWINLGPSLDNYVTAKTNAAALEIPYKLTNVTWCSSPCTININQPKNQEVIFSIYPTPAKDALNIELSSNEVYALTISDINGKNFVRTIQNIGTSIVDAKQLTPGIYFVIVTTKEGKRGVKKMIIQ